MDPTEVSVAKNLINGIRKGTLTDRIAIAKLNHFVHLLQAEAEADLINGHSSGDFGEGMLSYAASSYTPTVVSTLDLPAPSKIPGTLDDLDLRKSREPQELPLPRATNSTGFLTDAGRDASPPRTEEENGDGCGSSENSGRNPSIASSLASSSRGQQATRIPQAPRSIPRANVYANVSKDQLAGVRCPTVGCTNPFPHDDQTCYEIRYKVQLHEESDLSGSSVQHAVSSVRLQPLKQPQALPQTPNIPQSPYNNTNNNSNGAKTTPSKASYLPRYSKSKIQQSGIPQFEHKNSAALMPMQSSSKPPKSQIPQSAMAPQNSPKNPAAQRYPKPPIPQPQKQFDRKTSPFQSKTRIPTVQPQQPQHLRAAIQINHAALLEAINQVTQPKLAVPTSQPQARPGVGARRVPTRRQIPTMEQALNADPALAATFAQKAWDDTPKNFRSQAAATSSSPPAATFSKESPDRSAAVVSSDPKPKQAEESPTSARTPMTFTQLNIERSPRTARSPVSGSKVVNLNARDRSPAFLPQQEGQGHREVTPRPTSPTPTSPSMRRPKTKEYFTWLGM